MKIAFLGHASFLITTSGGKKIVTDPYEPGGFGGQIRHGPLKEAADYVTISHDHSDHNYVRMVPGNPVVVGGSADQREGDILFRALATYHDRSRGVQRGRNTVWVIEADGLTVCHLGDLGHALTPEDAAALGPIDVLMVPIGGTFTIDAGGATGVIDRLRPRIAIPMHFKTDKIGFDLAPVSEFIAGKLHVRRVERSEVEVSRDALPEPTEIVVLEPAL